MKSMSILDIPSKATPITPRLPRHDEAARVMQALDELCISLSPGDRVPTHVELMRRFGASERTVLRSLDELQRQGRIVRRHGAGTFIAEEACITASPEPATGGRTIVAIAAPDRSFFDRCMDQLYEYTADAGLDLVCRPLNLERDAAGLSAAALGHPLGFIVFGYPLAPLARRIQNEGMRVVVLGTPPAGETSDIPCVHGAQDHGGYLAAKHLLDLGHRRLAFVPSIMDITLSQRWQGVQRALREAKRNGQDAEVIAIAPQERDSWRDSPKRAAAYIRRKGGPTAILSWNDHECARLLSILLRAGVSVPNEVSLIGYDALPEGELVHPALTTVDPFMGQLLQMAVGLLTQTNLSASHTTVVMPSLVIRASTAPPRAE